ncbi:MAG: hypothetical protein ABI237_06105 [Ginsengibacter sp.]
MSNRWTMDDIKEKGLRIINTQEEKIIHKTTSKEKYEALGRMKGNKMNKTESAYNNYLEVQKRIGEVIWYEFEPMNLRLADKCFYKVDFLVLTKNFQLEVHEIKGYWTDDALVKIKTAAEKFPFRFISKQLVKGEWITREF